MVIVLFQFTDSNEIVKIEFERLAGTFAGTGDAFAAMFLAWFTITKDLKVIFLE